MLARRSLVLAAALALAAVTPASADDDPGAIVDAAAKAYEVALKRWESGAGPGDDIYTWSVRWLDAQRDLPLKGKALAAAASAHLERMKTLAERTRVKVDAGAVSALDAVATVFYVREAERWVKRKGKR